jgi:hypothetical protein
MQPAEPRNASLPSCRGAGIDHVDGTAVVSRREDTVQLRQALERLLWIGVSSIIITGTNFATIDQQLLATMRGPYKRNLYVSTNRGSEVSGFDAQSRPVLLWQRVARTGLEIRVVYDRLNRRKLDFLPLAAWRDPPKSAIGELWQAVEGRLKAAGLARGLLEVLKLVERLALEKGLRRPFSHRRPR